jgi:hypothetical protein
LFQQVFVPVSKGLIKSAPSSLIPDGSFQETLNVRFGDGYVEKVEGFQQFTQITHTINNETVPERIMKIHMYKKKDGSVKNIIHTKDGVYMIDSLTDKPVKLSDNDYKVQEFGHIDGVNAFDEYFFASLGSDIYYWNTGE